MSFDILYKKYAQKYQELISEADAQDPNAAPAPDPTAGAPVPPPAPAPAPAPKKEYDKPYQDLGIVLYKALRLNFDELPDEQKESILSIVPSGEESINSDEKAAALFDAVDKIVNEQGEVVPRAQQI